MCYLTTPTEYHVRMRFTVRILALRRICVDTFRGLVVVREGPVSRSPTRRKHDFIAVI